MRPHFAPRLVGEDNPSWRGDDVGYGGVHLRLSADPASNYSCGHCAGAASEWAYDHLDPEEKISGDGLRYSVKGRAHYVPLCSSCHRRFDHEEAVRQA